MKSKVVLRFGYKYNILSLFIDLITSQNNGYNTLAINNKMEINNSMNSVTRINYQGKTNAKTFIDF